jgi:hypothetical protein
VGVQSTPMIVGETPGADLPVLDELDAIVELTIHHEPLFVRYSEGPDRDREGPSTDYECGLVLPGLSAIVLTPPDWWTRPRRDWVARRLSRYADLMVAPRQPRPWLLGGRVIGQGTDDEPLVAAATPVAWVGRRALAQAVQLYEQRFVVGRDARWLPARTSGSSSWSVEHHSRLGESDTRCPFCFPAAVAPHQLLATTEHFYLLAPVGQILEGFLSIMTHACADRPRRLRCLDDIPAHWVAELDALRRLIASFHRDVYGQPTLFYEHGRGGGCWSSPPGGGYVFHPHLCALPGDHPVHATLTGRFSAIPAPAFPTVRSHIGYHPYLYVHTPDGSLSDAIVYHGNDRTSGTCVSRLSLKEILAEQNPAARAADWRQDPGGAELVRLVGAFNQWYAAAFRRSSDPALEGIFAAGPVDVHRHVEVAVHPLLDPGASRTGS